MKNRKVQIQKPGGYERLLLCEFDSLSPKENEVLVEVGWSGVNFADCLVRMGLYQSAKDYVGWPITPGFEFSGTVVATGAKAKKFKNGDKVFGLTRFGGYSSQICLSEEFLFACGSEMTMAEWAAFPTVFLTAYYPLFEQMKVRPGAKVLVHSAAGGVGCALVQLAKTLNCFVVGVVGNAKKRRLAYQVGADEVIDKSKDDLWKKCREICPEGFDIVFDANGAETLRGSFESMCPSGRLVIYGFHSMFSKNRGRPNWTKLIYDYLRTPRFNPLELTSANKSVLAFNLSYLFHKKEVLAEGMNFLLEAVRKNEIKPLPVELYKADEVAKSHLRIESGQSTGKLVLDWGI